MLKEAKRALPVRGTQWDEEISRLCKAAAIVLTTRGVVLPGTVDFDYNETTVTDSHGNPVIDPDTGDVMVEITVTDNSTLEDEMCLRAIITYVKANLGNPPNYDKLKASFDEQLGQLMTTTGYTSWHGEVVNNGQIQ